MLSALGPRAAGDGSSGGAGRGAGWLARLPLTVVIVTLVALLVVPILVSRRASALRSEMVEVVEPARLLVNDLELAREREAAALRGFIIDGHGRHLDEFREARVQEERALAGLRPLVGRLDPMAEPQLSRVEVLLNRWHERQEGVLAGRMTPAEFLVLLPAQDEVYREVLDATTLLRNTTVERAAEVGQEAAANQRLGVVLTSILVVMALVSILFVVRLGRRLERRAREEQALREATAAVAGASTVAETTQRIAQSALLATGAEGAFVESVDAARGELEVVAVAGRRVPPAGARAPYTGSLAREAVERAEPRLVTRLSEVQNPLPAGLVDRCGDCAAAVVPLINRGQPVGALFLLRAADRPFRPDELARAITFGELATLAIHKIRMLEESERRREELVRLTESRSRLMRGFGHDVKNPLGAADGQLQLLEEEIAGELSAEAREGVARARRSIRSALELIEDLLELARREVGQIEVERMPTDVREAARAIAEEYRAQAEAKGLALQTDLPDELPVVESDAARIRQVLSNLLSNALKYTERGRIGVRVEVRDNGGAPGPGRWIAVDVWDTGPGIPEEQQRLMFKEFIRLEPGTRRGAGVGLAISRGLARALGGEITVESEVGKGSTFTLWLPLGGREAAEQAEKAA